MENNTILVARNEISGLELFIKNDLDPNAEVRFIIKDDNSAEDIEIVPSTLSDDLPGFVSWTRTRDFAVAKDFLNEDYLFSQKLPLGFGAFPKLQSYAIVGVNFDQNPEDINDDGSISAGVGIFTPNKGGDQGTIEFEEAFNYDFDENGSIGIDNGQGTVGKTTAGFGAFEEGVLLIAGDISGDPEGLLAIDSYKWFKDDVAIAGAAGSQYGVDALGAGDYRVEITYTDNSEYQSTISSTAQTVIQIDNGDAGFELQVDGSEVTDPVIIGETIVAKQLTDDPDGNLETGTFINYKWETSSSPGGPREVRGTDATYTPDEDDAGKDLLLTITYTDSQGYSEIVDLSAATNETENQPPTDISLSATSFDENIAAESVVASFNTTDPDSGDTFSYSLIDGVGASDNALFTINSDQLEINESPDFESKQSYDIRVQTTDAAGLAYEKPFTLEVNDIDEQVDPITGTLGTPKRIKLKNRGKVKLALIGSEDIDVNEVSLDSLIFGGDQNSLTSEEPLEGEFFKAYKRPRGKNEGTYITKFKDVNKDGEGDLIITVLSADVSSVMDRSDTELFAYGEMGESKVLFENLNVTFI